MAKTINVFANQPQVQLKEQQRCNDCSILQEKALH